MPIQILINGLITGTLYALTALGFNVIYNGSKVFHIAHGAIYTASVYFYIALTGLTFTVFSSLPTLGFISNVILTILCISILAFLIEKIIYFPLSQRTKSPLVTLISSLGIYIIIINLIAMIFGNESQIINHEIEPSYIIGNLILTRIQIIQFFVSLIIIILTLIFISRSSLGTNIRALSGNSLLARVIGLNIKKIRIEIIVIGSVLPGIASLLVGFDVGVDPYVGFSAVLTAAVAVIIGGIDSYLGTVIGAVIIGLVQNIVIWFLSAQWQDAVTFVILIIVLLVKNQGLLSRELRLEEQ